MFQLKSLLSYAAYITVVREIASGFEFGCQPYLGCYYPSRASAGFKAGA